MPENWVTVAGWIGGLAATALVAFWKVYGAAREGERAQAARSPEVAAQAIGAAFVDRATSQDITAIRDEVRKLREIAEDRLEVEKREDIIDEVERRLRLK